LLELDTELGYLSLEVKKLLLDVASFLVLEGKNGFLYGSKSAFRNLNKLGLAVLKLYKEIFLHLDSVLLKKHNGLFHGFNLVKSAVLDHLDITKVGHNLHENFFFSLSLRTLRNNLYSISNFVDELLNVVNLSNSVSEKEAGVSLNPLGDSLLKFNFEW